MLRTRLIRNHRSGSRLRLPPRKASRPTSIGGAALGDYLRRRSAYDRSPLRPRTLRGRLMPVLRILAVLGALAILGWLGYHSILALSLLSN